MSFWKNVIQDYFQQNSWIDKWRKVIETCSRKTHDHSHFYYGKKFQFKF